MNWKSRDPDGVAARSDLPGSLRHCSEVSSPRKVAEIIEDSVR